MMPAILWKEYREHRSIWLTLAFLGAAAVFSRLIILRAGMDDMRIFALMLSVVLAGIYSLVCGAMMLAGEYENGTMSYLDVLPGFRRRLWQGKFAAGVLLVLGQIVLLMSLCAAASLFFRRSEAAWTLAAMLALGLFGLSWGMLFSAMGRSVMHVILFALAGYAALVFFAAILGNMIIELTAAINGTAPEYDLCPYFLGFAVLIAPAALAALAGSAVIFTRLDWRRLRNVPEHLQVEQPTLHPTWRKVLWLTWRQSRGFAVGMVLFALLLGFITLWQPVLLWPAATMFVGVLCGATAFADEQQGSFRFLGDQRLPLGWLWAVKVGARFAVAAGAALLMLAMCFIAALPLPPSLSVNSEGPYPLFAHVFHNDLLVSRFPPGLFLTLWLVYGFAAGCLFGLLFRDGLTAGFAALLTGLLAAAVWIPSLLCGGLHAWQVYGPPVLVLVASRLLMRPWAARRIASWTTALRLSTLVVLAALWVAGSLWYRVLEIPTVHVSLSVDAAAFRASLPAPEQEESGRLFRSASLGFDELRRTLESEEKSKDGMERALESLEHGWPNNDHKLTVWMDKMNAGDWLATLKQAADLPASPFDDVRNMTFITTIPATVATRNLAVVLAVRGLQQQAAGDDAAYLENLRIGLSLSRSLRDHTPPVDLLTGRAVEATLLKGLDRWLDKLRGRPDLLRQTLALLSRHLEATAEDNRDVEAIEALIKRNTLDTPGASALFQKYTLGDPVSVWFIPWEQARKERIFRIMYYGDQEQQNWLIANKNAMGPLLQLGSEDFMKNRNKMTTAIYKPDELCAARAMQLKLALRWYQADNGKPADNLDELVPKYLPSIPINPYDNAPFLYELSRGEEIALPPQKIPSGQGLLWSEAKDRVFLVPLPPKAK